MSKYLKSLVDAIEKRLDGRTHAWLCDRTKITKSKMSRILAGKNEPDLSDLMAIAQALDVSLGDLVGESVPATRASRTGGGRSKSTHPTLADFHLDAETMAKVLPWLLAAVPPVQLAALFLLSKDERFLEYFPEDQVEGILSSLKVV